MSKPTKYINILRKFNRNEGNNFHSENLLLLATHFGTKHEVEEAHKRVKNIHSDLPNYEIPRHIEDKIDSYYQVLIAKVKEEKANK